ncbi:MAG TPA: hypothetical protein VG388_05185 [Solirubrobacteraceae bacterium]|nr:hypothetical protein [Solirubrobacteraceae bacterium]
MTNLTETERIHMSAIPYDTPDRDREATEQEASAPPRRARRHFFNRKSAALAAAITCAAGFYAGVHVEKGQLTSAASAATSAPGAATGARTGAPSGVTGAGAAGGFAGRFGGAGAVGGAGGSASIGTISSINGNTIYLTDTTGNTVKVALSPSAKVSKSLSVSKSSLHPGDALVVQGVKNSSGTVVATSVSDSGARTTGATTGATGGGSTNNGSSTTGG